MDYGSTFTGKHLEEKTLQKPFLLAKITKAILVFAILKLTENISKTINISEHCFYKKKKCLMRYKVMETSFQEYK